MFIIDFQHAEDDLELCLRVLALLNALKELFAGDGNDAPVGSIANHGVRLATACLPIGKERTVVAFPGISKHATAQIFKHFFLYTRGERHT